MKNANSLSNTLCRIGTCAALTFAMTIPAWAQNIACQTADGPIPEMMGGSGGSGGSCVDASPYSGANNTDYIPLATDDILTVRVIIHVMQKSNPADPQNFRSDIPAHMDFLNAILDGIPGSNPPSVNKIYGEVADQIFNGVVTTAVVGDTRVRFSVQDILFHKDDVGWSNNGSFCAYTSNYCFDNYAVEPCKYLNVFIIGRTSGTYFTTAGCGPAEDMLS